MFIETMGAAAYKRAVMSSEDPDLDWIIRAWRGLRSYLAAAIRSLDHDDLSTRTDACRKASDLFVLLRRITSDGQDCALGQRLGVIYDTLHIELAKANAAGDRMALQRIVSALTRLEADFSSAQRDRSPTT